ncbi:aspartyl protease family protein [Pedobacter sp. Leaf176]|uniref:aspartyl protease family protein n=1 Tax=Pedobacter sp. Leaf176 TaxID=1736286 RepID=UPI0006FD7735|nr:aspartyl protease family protein [Pedobacter sp. Leaf176]KQR67723.1 clan AA aspartic protease [Pedobacter sp. Leaf176]
MINKLLLTALLLSSVNVFAQNFTLQSDSMTMKVNEQNTIYVKAVFNKIDTLTLNFDTGTTELVLTNDLMKSRLKTLVKLYNTPYELKLGNSVYKTKVYDAELTGHGTDGRFGWDLFKGKTVELNYDRELLVIHSNLPDYIKADKGFSKSDLKFYQDLLLISGEIRQGETINRDLFLFDTGYQRTVMLDQDLLASGGFPSEKMEVIKKVIMKGAQGNEIPVITSTLQELTIGGFQLKNIPVQRTTANKPLRDKNIHILGNEVLKRFNIFLDLQENQVYLKPNRHYKDHYIDKKK